jgi:dual specificity phosphatase 12
MREHIIEHEPGMGQQAFAIHRRDMAKHRQEQEQRRQREQLKAATSGKPASSGAANSQPAPTSNTPPPPPAASNNTPAAASTLSARVSPNLRVALPAPFATSAFNPDDSALSTSPPTPDAPLLSSTNCSSYFTEPLSWMSSQLEDGQLGGRLVCPNKKCGAKIGSFDWAGLQCSCGAWVTPGFSISASKVDEIG